MPDDYLTHPIDATSAARMKDAGLRMDLLDKTDEARSNAWWEAMTRGFHGGAITPERMKEMTEGNAFRRATGIWDDANTSLEPVGTVDSWPTRLAVPGGTTIQSWAISGVTVASTHHGRGIARAMLEGELRTATELGVPMAMLTVSESSLYQRYGFAPAAFAANYEFDIRRTKWSGPTPEGRVEYTSLPEFADALGELHERLVPTRPGMIDLWPLRVSQLAGTSAADDDRAKKLRAIRYVDAEGVTRGIANYRLSGGDDDFVNHTLTVEHLITETPDAGAALWRYLLEVPLVAKVKVEHRPLDEPVLWMITDWRAGDVTLWEHQYLRILDVKAVFEARGYLADGEVIFDVTDPLGHAMGRWQLTVQDGVGHVTEAAPDADVPTLTLGVSELSAIYLGGVKPSTLVSAGRISGSEPGSAAHADDLLRSAATPFLSIWY